MIHHKLLRSVYHPEIWVIHTTVGYNTSDIHPWNPWSTSTCGLTLTWELTPPMYRSLCRLRPTVLPSDTPVTHHSKHFNNINILCFHPIHHLCIQPLPTSVTGLTVRCSLIVFSASPRQVSPIHPCQRLLKLSYSFMHKHLLKRHLYLTGSF